MKKELVIVGHPDAESFCHSLADEYIKSAIDAGKQVDVIKLNELDFKISLAHGYRKRTELEPDLLNAQQLIKEANHLVWIFPDWWSSIPAILKGFIDRVFLPGWAFERGAKLPEKLLKGKTSIMLVTMDSPKWYFKYFMREPIKHSFARGTLAFCGIKNKKIYYFCPLKTSTAEKRAAWLEKVSALAKELF